LAKNLEKIELEKHKNYDKQIHEDFNLAKQLEISLNHPISEIMKKDIELDRNTSPGEGHSKNLIMIEDLQSVGSKSEAGDDGQTDEVIARLLQAEFDLEYDEQLKRVEKNRNKDSKVSISYQKFRLYPDDLLFDSEEEIDDPAEKKDWDHFEANEREISKIGRSGYNYNESGRMITKHDAELRYSRRRPEIMFRESRYVICERPRILLVLLYLTIFF
jgi:YD repeat-containing protein